MEDFGEFLSFRKMITPVIIQILFWIGVVACVVGGIVSIVLSFSTRSPLLILYGLLILVLGPILVRVYCELLILFFRMNDTLNEIHRKMDRD